jgi:hypothetical protein
MTGAFDTAVSSYESLLSLARSQGAVGGQNRGACKKCGQLGHLTKQCYNNISLAARDAENGAAVLAPVLPPVLEGNSDSSELSLTDSSSDDSDSDGSGSSSDSSEDRRRKRKEKARKSKRKERKDGKKKDKRKRKHKKEKKSRKRRRPSSSSSTE